jgi:hypothetical protein
MTVNSESLFRIFGFILILRCLFSNNAWYCKSISMRSNQQIDHADFFSTNECGWLDHKRKQRIRRIRN